MMTRGFVEVNLKVACTCVWGIQMLCLNVQLLMTKSMGIQPGKEKEQYSKTRLAKQSEQTRLDCLILKPYTCLM